MTNFTSKDLLFKYQSGFRRKLSTETCLIHLTDFIRFHMDEGHFVGMILFDLQKAFDTVNYSILLTKFKDIGLSGSAVNWFSSYLSDRQQLVDVSGTFSSETKIECGVPQGSIMGPLLFLIYVNDMPAVVKHKLLIYADDAALLVHGKNLKDIQSSLSSELEMVNQWLISNKLSLHLGKTESILFGSKHRLKKSQSNLNISCKGESIEAKDSVKYLGATIDQTLFFHPMARSVLSKVKEDSGFCLERQSFFPFTPKNC